MPSCCSSSPEAAAADPVQEGTISPDPTQDSTAARSQTRKSKKASGSTRSINQQTFNGKTFACVSCKNGHRVKSCNHGYNRPISATNQPGRPSSGSKRKCTCPKDCECFDKENCKCKRNCVCVEPMYLIVHVSKQDFPRVSKVAQINREPSPVLSRINDEGKEEYLQKVYTDLSGKQLSDDETLRRIKEREKREKQQEQKKESKSETLTTSPPDFSSIPWSLNSDTWAKESSTIPSTPMPLESKASCCSSKSASGQLSPAQSQAGSSAPIGGCQHASNASQTQVLYHPLPTRPSIFQQIPTQGCNCGATCQCIHCPEHANNAPTLQYNHQQFTHMAKNAYLPSDFQIPGPLFRPEVPQASCMGGPTTFRLSTRPPEPAEYSQLFPDAKPGSFVMQYEVRRTPQPGFQQYVQEINSLGPYRLPDTLSSESIDEMDINQNSGPVQFDFDSVMDEGFIGWDNVTIGEASVNQVPGMQSTAVPSGMGFSANAIPSNMQSPYQPPMAFLRSGNGNANAFNNITLPGFVPSSDPGFFVDPQLPVLDRPNEVGDLPGSTDFNHREGPFMGHPTSPLPHIASPVPVHSSGF